MGEVGFKSQSHTEFVQPRKLFGPIRLIANTSKTNKGKKLTDILQRFVFNSRSCSSEDPISHLQGHLTSSVMVRPRWMRGGASGEGVYSVEREEGQRLLTHFAQ